MHKPTQLYIISGLSGSGKTVALHTLEDAGFYCIDNLPISMLGHLGNYLQRLPAGTRRQFAVGVDARSQPEDLQHFGSTLDSLRVQELDPSIVFFTAQETTLIRRFSETRRRHPLSQNGISLAEAIRQEWGRLSVIQGEADLVIDTSTTNVHQLRDLVRKRLTESPPGVSILVQSFGYKHGIPVDADFVFDIRCLPNPHWEPGLRRQTGKDAEVIAYLQQSEDVRLMERQIRTFLEQWIPAFERENRSYLTVAIGCTGGQHRSVYLAEQLAAHFRSLRGEQVKLIHRELPCG
ncbi:RNase adapter RapZ [Methylonatrum kenyense]|uniref:RNase adapter RapZ n=1 Tax=Methylonatrum kenyense TaxID=455253 RepID=UPI0020BF2AC4|nr:RNase adapter RapZ [Methylonatrum kenyense]MCK8516253.1 RNase adapter RapZ [Methylonatrum kenyense]